MMKFLVGSCEQRPMLTWLRDGTVLRSHGSSAVTIGTATTSLSLILVKLIGHPQIFLNLTS